MLTGKGLLWWELESTRGTRSLVGGCILLTPTTETEETMVRHKDSFATLFAFTRCFLMSIPVNIDCLEIALPESSEKDGGLRQQQPVEADGGEWKRDAAAAFVTAAPGGGVKPSSPPVTCPVRNVPLYLSQRPRRARYTLIHHRLVLFSLTSIKYITAATRPALTTTPRRLGALDKDSAVTTAYTNRHHGRHQRPRRDVPAHGH